MIIDKLPQIKMIKSQEDIDDLATLCMQKGHGSLAPSHLVRKEGKVVGYFSVGQAPLVMCWIDPEAGMSPRDSLSLIMTVENVVAMSSSQGVIVPVTRESPFHAVMAEFKYQNNGPFDLFHKEF